MILGFELLPVDRHDEEIPPQNRSHWATDSLDDMLLFRVELWDDSKTQPELLLAAARTAMVAYAAYFAAANDFPHRVITLRRKGRILAHWAVGHH
jgi:hypothetical protein